MIELDKTAIFLIYISPFLLLFISWILQIIIEDYYDIKSNMGVTIILSVIVYAILNSINSIFILGYITEFIFSLLFVMIGIVVFLILTFTEHNKASNAFLVIIIIICLFQTYLVYINL